jgi:cytochrome P450
MSFGYGPRECPGMALSLAEAPLIVAHIVRHFDFKLACPAEEIERVTGITVGPNKMPIIFTVRRIE